MLDLARMLKSTVYNGSQDLGLQQEVSEPAAMDGDVVALDSAFFLGLHSILSGVSLWYFDQLFHSRAKQTFTNLLVVFLLFVIQKIIVDIGVSHCNPNVFSENIGSFRCDLSELC